MNYEKTRSDANTVKRCSVEMDNIFKDFETSMRHVGAENVGYAIKTSYLKSLVESVTSASVLPQTNRVANQNLSGKVKAVKNYVYYITCSK